MDYGPKHEMSYRGIYFNTSSFFLSLYAANMGLKEKYGISQLPGTEYDNNTLWKTSGLLYGGDLLTDVTKLAKWKKKDGICFHLII